jgi:hypothetical protein
METMGTRIKGETVGTRIMERWTVQASRSHALRGNATRTLCVPVPCRLQSRLSALVLQRLFQKSSIFLRNGGIYAHTGPDFKSSAGGLARLNL